jgi:hypothetical protein
VQALLLLPLSERLEPLQGSSQPCLCLADGAPRVRPVCRSSSVCGLRLPLRGSQLQLQTVDLLLQRLLAAPQR